MGTMCKTYPGSENKAPKVIYLQAESSRSYPPYTTNAALEHAALMCSYTAKAVATSSIQPTVIDKDLAVISV